MLKLDTFKSISSDPYIFVKTKKGGQGSGGHLIAVYMQGDNFAPLLVVTRTNSEGERYIRNLGMAYVSKVGKYVDIRYVKVLALDKARENNIAAKDKIVPVYT